MCYSVIPTLASVSLLHHSLDFLIIQLLSVHASPSLEEIIKILNRYYVSTYVNAGRAANLTAYTARLYGVDKMLGVELHHLRGNQSRFGLPVTHPYQGWHLDAINCLLYWLRFTVNAAQLCKQDNVGIKPTLAIDYGTIE